MPLTLACPHLQARYTYLTNITRIRELVDQYSTMQNSTWLQGGECPLTSRACYSWVVCLTTACLAAWLAMCTPMLLLSALHP